MDNRKYYLTDKYFKGKNRKNFNLNTIVVKWIKFENSNPAKIL